MKKEYIFFAILCCFFLNVSAQNKQPLINSGETLKQGFKLHDDGKYKEAIALYKQIPRSDTNYSKALYELAYSSYSDSNFIASKQYAELGLKLFPDEATQWYLQIANAEDELGNTEKAIFFYDKIIAVNPNDYINWFNKGVTYFKKKDYTEAKKSLQKCLLIYPYYASAHYYLGAISVEEGKPVQAMLSFCANLFMTPESKHLGKVITNLSAIADVKDEVLKKVNSAKKKSKEDDFEMVQEILLSKASLDKHYKLKSGLEDNITRQIQVVLEKLEFNASDKGFWMQFYVPFYKQIFDDKQFENFSYYIFSGINSKSIKDYIKKNQKSIDKFIQTPIEYFNTIKETQVLEVAKREGVKSRFLFNGKNISGKGAWQFNGKDYTLTGPWEFYYSNGNFRSKGIFNDKGEKEGEWNFYYSNGQLKEKDIFSNGEINGKVYAWYDNGVQASISEYKKDQIDGTLEQWYYNAAPRKIEAYTANKKNGIGKSFTNYGYLNHQGNYKDDLENGPLTYYYNNGRILSSSNYTDGKANGILKKYYYEGGMQLEGEFINDKKNGLWKEYYSNGKLKVESNYTNGELDGPSKEYHDNGKLMQLANYSKGKVDGKLEDFDEDGKLYSESTFEKGRLREIKFLDKSGKEISNTTTRRGAANLTFYDAVGNKVSEGFFSKDGYRQGKTNFFYRNGKISVEAEYKDGQLNGNRKAYYINGNLSEEVNYSNDEEDGYYTSFYSNKIIKKEGWIVNGKKQGEQVDYNKLGKATTKSYFVDDENSGYTEYYFADGKIDYEQKWENGWVRRLTQFDTAGNVLEDIDMPKGNSDFTFKYFNGKTYIKGAYKNNHLHGKYNIFFPDGSLSYSTVYNQGNCDSITKQYFFGGKLKYEGNYKLGYREGVWKYYHENGKLNYAYNYVNGNIQGSSITYNDDGTKDKEFI
jgi:antitoxin component YwqK of YwqJK toxin-antitoxin module